MQRSRSSARPVGIVAQTLVLPTDAAINAREIATALTSTSHWLPDYAAHRTVARRTYIAPSSAERDLERILCESDGSVELIRDAPPRYTLRYLPSRWLSSVSFECHTVQVDALPLYFGMGDVIAASSRLEYGFVQPLYSPTPRPLEELGVIAEYPQSYRRFGPSRLYARTFIGPRLAAVIGKSIIAEMGCHVSHLAGGVVRLDVDRCPWEIEPTALAARLKDIQHRFQQLGVLSLDGRTPGSRWTPPA